jgi:hypothetical protein
MQKTPIDAEQLLRTTLVAGLLSSKIYAATPADEAEEIQQALDAAGEKSLVLVEGRVFKAKNFRMAVVLVQNTATKEYTTFITVKGSSTLEDWKTNFTPGIIKIAEGCFARTSYAKALDAPIDTTHARYAEAEGRWKNTTYSQTNKANRFTNKSENPTQVGTYFNVGDKLADGIFTYIGSLHTKYNGVGSENRPIMPLIVTGHSLGAGVAQPLMVDLLVKKKCEEKGIQPYGIFFAVPAALNKRANALIKERCVHFRHGADVVPHVGKVLNIFQPVSKHLVDAGREAWMRRTNNNTYRLEIDHPPRPLWIDYWQEFAQYLRVSAQAMNTWHKPGIEHMMPDYLMALAAVGDVKNHSDSELYRLDEAKKLQAALSSVVGSLKGR